MKYSHSFENYRFKKPFHKIKNIEIIEPPFMKILKLND